MEYQLITPRIPLTQNLTAVERVLTNRGIELQDIEHYLHTTDEDIIEPSTIARIRDGVQMLIRHIAQNDKVLLQIDSDCDGYTSAAALLNYLNCLFPAFVQNNIIYRIHEGKQHGVIPDTIPEGVKLVIAPDSSSNDFEEHEYLKTQRGIDVLVIDHHEADHVSKYACIINNQMCDYPTKSLSGVGMVYKFCCYIDEIMGVDYADQFLDITALGIIADMMDLRDFETRHLIIKGLNNIQNPFLKEIVKKNEYSLRDGLSPMGIAFYVAPFVNATIRMGTQEEKLTLFESMLEYRGYEEIPSTKRGCKGQFETRAEQACRNCTNIKSRQTKSRDASLDTIEQIIKDKNLIENKILMIKLDEKHSIDRNLTGLIANQLMAKYQRPVLLLSKVVTKKEFSDKDSKTSISETVISWEGSGRGYDKSRLTDFKAFLNKSGLVEYAEGHANAFGVSVLDCNFIPLVEYCNSILKDFDFTSCYNVDFIFDGMNFKPSDILEIAELRSLWGQGVEEPYIAIESVRVNRDNIKLMSPDRSPTLKIELPNGVTLIKFKSSKEEYETLKSDLGNVIMNVVGRCDKNVYNGTITPQITIENYEITKKIQYYF